MKVILLAGGFGTRISEESHLRPKPMIEIGGKPILWHIMKIYSHYGFNDFIICCGYKSYFIKEYFANYFTHNCDLTFDFRNGKNEMCIHDNFVEPWKVTLVDTGLNTMTGGRLKRVERYVSGETFMLTYGDGVSDVNIEGLLKFHKSHGKIATLTSVRPAGRFGALDLDNSSILSFREKRQKDTGWINAGFMVFEPEIFNYLDNDETILEKTPLEELAALKKLMAFKHEGFWQCMDTQRDKQYLEALWNTGNAPWKSY